MQIPDTKLIILDPEHWDPDTTPDPAPEVSPTKLEL